MHGAHVLITTPPDYRILAPTTAAPVTGTTETLPSFVASLEPPPMVTPTLDTSATETAVVVAPLPIETPLEPQGQAIVLASTSQPIDLGTETTE